MQYKYIIISISFLTIILSGCLNIERDYSNQPEKSDVEEKIVIEEKDVKDSIPNETNQTIRITPTDSIDAIAKFQEQLSKAEEEKKKKATMRQEHVQSLRRAIDLYKKYQQPNVYLDNLAIDISKDNTINDPEKKDVYSMKRMLDEGYLDGKFVLFRVDEKTPKSIELDIMFRHKQDRIFRVWMFYDSMNDYFIVRSIFVPAEYDENDLRLYRKLYSIYLNDDNFGV